MHLRCKNNILSTYLLHSKNLHKKYDNGKRNRKKNIQVQLWMNQKDNRIANLHNLDDLQQKNKRGNSLV